MFKKIFFTLLFLAILALSAGAGALYYTVVLHPGPEIDQSNIEAILGKESPVFYNDNQTKLGVFFDQAHRQYVKYVEIPEEFVNALVAAEDNRFFEHIGFDIFGIGRAAIKNIEAGRVVQGGSTLTQQTAKNLFKRTERSFKAKAKELLFALRLEYRYPKEKIFEFYANQFYVSGNGHGLGVAARYYFDKRPSELTLVECAFIAGSVKRPNFYNPFIKKTRQDAEMAKARARTRLRYVLGKMLELQMIGQGAYNEALATPIGFKQGKVGYSLDYVMELVKDAVSSSEVVEALAQHGIENVSTSGIRVITTVDKKVQQKTLYSLRHDLSRVDVLLNGYEREEVQEFYNTLEYTGDNRLDHCSFLFGQIKAMEGKGENIRVIVDFGRKLGTGVIDAQGLQQIIAARVKWQKNVWTEPKKNDLTSLIRQLKEGDKVWVSVRETSEDATVLLELEKYPQVQGGAMVMKDGAILAMAGGTENRFYNRAVYAQRTMGSSFKPFVFAAATQLGWNSSDLLSNRRDVFIYHNQPYFPRPDHFSPFDHVSMNWAGVKSENLASVWLLSHLCDHLNPIQFRDVADHLGLAPRVVDGDREPYRSYRARVRDKYGIVVTRDVLRKAAYSAAVRNSAADFMFENMLEEYTYFQRLHYGQNFQEYSDQIDEQLKAGRKLKDYEIKELKLRKDILGNSFLILEELREDLRKYREIIDDPLGLLRVGPAQNGEVAAGLFFNGANGRYVFQAGNEGKEYLRPVNLYELQERLHFMNDSERDRFWSEVYLKGELSVNGFDLLANQLEEEYRRLQRALPYSFEVLTEIDDFRTFVGLKYLIALAREMGIRSSLAPVLSFPLGSNVVTLLEATRMYEAMITGKVTTYGMEPHGEQGDSLLILDRIESEDGTLLYKPKRNERKVMSERSRLSVGHILENVVKFGTGRRADKEVRLGGGTGNSAEIDIPVPLLGKTGTANRYTNASFFGYLPGVAQESDGLVSDDGYAVGVYTGYDDNLPMRKSTIKISGSAGALPTWIGIVKLLLDENYAPVLDPVDLSFGGLRLKRQDLGQLNLAADPESGGVLTSPAREAGQTNRYQPSILTFGKLSVSGRFSPDRSYEPFWRLAQKQEQSPVD